MEKKFLLLLIALGLLLFSSCTAQQEAERTPLLLISIDGLKPSDVNKTDTPVLDMLTANGTVAESMIPVFPSSTFPNHYSLATGLYTNSTGVISNTMFDPEMERWFRLSDRSAVGDGRWYGGEPIWVTAENNDIRTATMFWPGSEAEIQGVRPTRWLTYDGSIPYKSRADSIVTWLTLEDETRPDFLTLYFSRVDSEGHRHGAGADSVLSAITYVDNVLGYMIERLTEEGIWPNINVLITSDHGMVSLSHDHLIFIDDIIDLDDVNIINWSPVVMIQPREGKREQVYETLKAAEENYSVYFREDFPERFHFGAHPRVPEIIMLADISDDNYGWTITSKSFYERRGILGGTHGYDNMHPEMHGYFLAFGPDIKENKTIETFEVINIYEVMCKLLGIEPAPNDGDLEVLRPIIR